MTTMLVVVAMIWEVVVVVVETELFWPWVHISRGNVWRLKRETDHKPDEGQDQ